MHHIITLRTITPLHIGTGQAVGTTDLPIARERTTGWPVVPGSSAKGVLKDAARIAYLEASGGKRSRESGASADREIAYLFGSADNDNPSAGSMAITDMRCLLFPVRSLAGTFAYATSKLAIQRANQLLAVAGKAEIPEAAAVEGKVWVPNGTVLRHGTKAYLEDLDLELQEGGQDPSEALAEITGVKSGDLRSRLAVLSDDLFTYLTKSATEVVTHVTLDFETRTASGGMLRSEERVPSEAVFLGLSTLDKLHASDRLEDASKYLANMDGSYLQFGGKASVGNGLCQVGIR